MVDTDTRSFFLTYFCLSIFFLLQSDGVSETMMLARKYVDQAVKDISFLDDSVYKDALSVLGEMVINRDR